LNAHAHSFAPEVPNAIEAEQALLGLLMLNPKGFDEVSDILSPDDFFEPLHRKVFDVASELIRMGKKATPPTLITFLAFDMKIGGMTVAQYLAKLCAEAVSLTGAAGYAGAIKDASFRRALVSVGQDIAEIGYQADASATRAEMVARAQDRLFTLSAGDEGQDMMTARDEADRMMTGQGTIRRPTVPLPLPQLREVMGEDLEAGNLYGMLSGSGEGKTSMVLQIVRHAAEQGHPVLFLSYDQLWDQCLLQMVSQRLGIEHHRLKDDNRLQSKERDLKWDAVADLRSLPMAFKKCSGRRDGSAQIASYAKRFLITYAPRFEKVPLIVLDHVRKVKPKNERDHEGRVAAEINGVCKDVASEHDAVWLSLNQRSSAGAKRKNPRPIDADLYGGEMAREDYDGMFYLYRAWKYRTAQLATAADEREEREVETRFTRGKWEEDHAELGTLKVRYGDPSVRRRIRFEAQYTRYVSMRDEGPPELFEGSL
jgi:replicative DNA helicase